MKQLTASPFARSAAILFILAVVVLNSWVDEDAFITYRVIINFVSGYGPRFNIDERVQAFTHPLWFFLTSTTHFLTEDMVFTMIFTGSLCTLLALSAVLGRLPKDLPTLGLAMVILLFSRAFIHFSTSGLENSLTHLLCALFCLILIGRERLTGRSIFLLTLCAGLSVVNRLDTVLLYSPALLYVLLTHRSRATVLAMFAGLVPMFAWLAFSLVYYGFFFPNTFYAKVATDVNKSELYSAGLFYFEHSIVRDPVTLTTTALAIVLALIAGSNRIRALAVGIILYLLYVISVGADYMCGRFFSATLLISVCILMAFRWRPLLAGAYAFAALVAGFIAGGAPIMTRLDSTADPIIKGFDQTVVDTQLHFYQGSGLPYLLRHGLIPLRRSESAPTVEFIFGIHMDVPRSPFQFHLADDLALVDPLLARLPSRGYWRPGHFQRDIPAGYPAVLRGERAALCDASLDEFKRHLDELTRAPIWSAERFKTIYAMNTGQYDHLVNKAYYKNPEREVSLSDFNSKHGVDWCLSVLPSRGIRIVLPEIFHKTKIQTMSLEGEVVIARFFKGDMMLEQSEFGQRECTGRCDELVPSTITVPQKAVEQGYDSIRFLPYRRAAIGEQRLGALQFE